MARTSRRSGRSRSVEQEEDNTSARVSKRAPSKVAKRRPDAATIQPRAEKPTKPRSSQRVSSRVQPSSTPNSTVATKKPSQRRLPSKTAPKTSARTSPQKAIAKKKESSKTPTVAPADSIPQRKPVQKRKDENSLTVAPSDSITATKRAPLKRQSSRLKAEEPKSTNRNSTRRISKDDSKDDKSIKTVRKSGRNSGRSTKIAQSPTASSRGSTKTSAKGSSRDSKRSNGRSKAQASKSQMPLLIGISAVTIIIIACLVIIANGKNAPKGKVTRDEIGQGYAKCEEALALKSKDVLKAKILIGEGLTIMNGYLDKNQGKLSKGKRIAIENDLIRFNMASKDIREKAIMVNAQKGH